MHLSKRNKVQNAHCVQIKGGLERHLELAIETLIKLYRTNWTCTESDKKLIVVFSSDSARHRVTIEGDENASSFSLTVMSRKLCIVGHTTTQ